MYLISSLKEHLDIGLNPRNLRAVFIPLRYSFIPVVGLVSLSPGPPAAERAGTDSRFPVTSFPKIILHLLRPITVSILFFSLPWSLFSPLNLGAGFGRINHFAAVRKGYLLSVSINIYCYCCLLSCFFPLGIML